MMKTIFIGGLFLALFLFVMPIVTSPAQAAFLQFNNTAATVNAGQTIDVAVKVDPTPAKITSIDGYVTYDSTVLQAQSVTDGTYFPTVFNDITTQRVYVAGIVNSPATFKEGVGTVATITFKALKNGSTTLAFKCVSSAGSEETSKIIKNDVNATNIIECSKNGSLAVTVGGAISTTTTTTPTTTVVPTTAPSQLPQSGVIDNLLKYSGTGIALLVVGIALRFL